MPSEPVFSSSPGSDIPILRDSDWFAPHSDFQPSPEKGPSPRLTAIWFDESQDLLWTMVKVADEEWQEGVGEAYDGSVEGGG